MRKISWLTLVASFCMLSCGDGKPPPSSSSIKEESETGKQLTIGFSKTGFSDFVVTKDIPEYPSSIAYVFAGSIKNTTDNIYQKVFLRCELFFVLKNNKVLSSEDMSGLLTSSLNFYNWRHWKPNAIEDIPKVTSSPLDVEYADYPVTKVVERMTLDLTDGINDTTTTAIVEQLDVTDKWEAAVAKVKDGNYDCRRDNIESWMKSHKKY